MNKSIGLMADTSDCCVYQGVLPWGYSIFSGVGTFSLMPVKELDTSDRGDDVERRFRYQHGYGALLLIAATNGDLPFTGIWCEQRDDILAERQDGRFESYQVKTSTPQDGRITLKNEGFRNALHKWVELEQEFSDKIVQYHFVSNSPYESRKSKLEASPVELIKAVKNASDVTELDKTYTSMLDTTASYVECDSVTLFSVLKKSELVQGPGLESFTSEISHDHLAKLPACSNLSAVDLDALRDELLQQVHSASSLDIRDSSRHWTSILEVGLNDPVLQSKRIEVADLEMMVNQHKQVPLRFAPGSLTLRQAIKGEKIDAFTEKLLRGDLAHYLENMKIRKLCAENYLLELSDKAPEDIEDIENQIACFVKGICDDAHLQASEHGEPFGKAMLRIVQSKVIDALQQRADHVHHLPFEVLVGVAGLLTEECEVWWSERFNLSGKV